MRFQWRMWSFFSLFIFCSMFLHILCLFFMYIAAASQVFHIYECTLCTKIAMHRMFNRCITRNWTVHIHNICMFMFIHVCRYIVCVYKQTIANLWNMQPRHEITADNRLSKLYVTACVRPEWQRKRICVAESVKNIPYCVHILTYIIHISYLLSKYMSITHIILSVYECNEQSEKEGSRWAARLSAWYIYTRDGHRRSCCICCACAACRRFQPFSCSVAPIINCMINYSICS